MQQRPDRRRPHEDDAARGLVYASLFTLPIYATIGIVAVLVWKACA